MQRVRLRAGQLGARLLSLRRRATSGAARGERWLSALTVQTTLFSTLLQQSVKQANGRRGLRGALGRA